MNLHLIIEILGGVIFADHALAQTNKVKGNSTLQAVCIFVGGGLAALKARAEEEEAAQAPSPAPAQALPTPPPAPPKAPVQVIQA